jgi:hypothetical protein
MEPYFTCASTSIPATGTITPAGCSPMIRRGSAALHVAARYSAFNVCSLDARMGAGREAGRAEGKPSPCSTGSAPSSSRDPHRLRGIHGGQRLPAERFLRSRAAEHPRPVRPAQRERLWMAVVRWLQSAHDQNCRDRLATPGGQTLHDEMRVRMKRSQPAGDDLVPTTCALGERPPDGRQPGPLMTGPPSARRVDRRWRDVSSRLADLLRRLPAGTHRFSRRSGSAAGVRTSRPSWVLHAAGTTPGASGGSSSLAMTWSRAARAQSTAARAAPTAGPSRNELRRLLRTPGPPT